jgi:hypothetical protein
MPPSRWELQTRLLVVWTKTRSLEKYTLAGSHSGRLVAHSEVTIRSPATLGSPLPRPPRKWNRPHGRSAARHRGLVLRTGLVRQQKGIRTVPKAIPLAGSNGRLTGLDFPGAQFHLGTRSTTLKFRNGGTVTTGRTSIPWWAFQGSRILRRAGRLPRRRLPGAGEASLLRDGRLSGQSSCPRRSNSPGILAS